MSRNRTIRLNEEEYERFLGKCLKTPQLNLDIINKTIQGDTFKVLEKLPNNFVDLLIVDPPYNLDKVYNNVKFKKMGDIEYENYTRRWIELVKLKLKEKASVYVCCDWKTSLLIGKVLQDYFIIQNRITWQREKGRGSLNNWKNNMEDIWFVTNSKEYVFNVDTVKQRRVVLAPYKDKGKPKDWLETEQGNFRDSYPSNFWDDISIPFWSMPENTDHPTQKPEKLMAKLILASSNEGDVVLDIFGGVGTTAVVSKKLNRKYVSIEQDKLYSALTEKRLDLADKDKTIQGYVNGVFWERNTLKYQKNL